MHWLAYPHPGKELRQPLPEKLEPAGREHKTENTAQRKLTKWQCGRNYNWLIQCLKCAGYYRRLKKWPRDLIFHCSSSAAVISYQHKVGAQSSWHRTSALYVAFLFSCSKDPRERGNQGHFSLTTGAWSLSYGIDHKQQTKGEGSHREDLSPLARVEEGIKIKWWQYPVTSCRKSKELQNRKKLVYSLNLVGLKSFATIDVF